MSTVFAYYKGPPRGVVRTAVGSQRSCKDCRYNKDNKCILFLGLNKNFEVTHPSIEVVRLNTELCGPDGKYFKSHLKK
jgi:hypothetical protein